MQIWLREQWAARASPGALFVQLYVVNVVLATALGVVLLASGERRFHGPSFASAKTLVAWLPFEPHAVWGAGFVTLAVFLTGCLGRHRPAVWSLRAGMLIYLFLCIATLSSFVFKGDEPAAFIGIACGIFASIHLLISVHVDGYGWR